MGCQRCEPFLYPTKKMASLFSSARPHLAPPRPAPSSRAIRGTCTPRVACGARPAHSPPQAAHKWRRRAPPPSNPPTRFTLALRAAPSNPPPTTLPPTALLLECDGVVLDAHNDAHRVAFNRAFATLGYPRTVWTPALYSDLIRVGDGSPEGLLAVYYGTVGWPDSLGDTDSPATRQAWADAVGAAKNAALSLMVADGSIPLRAGVLDLIDEAAQSGCVLGLLAATASAPGERLVTAALDGLGRDRRAVVFTVPGGDGAGALEGSGDDSDGGGGGAPTRDTPPGTSLEMDFAAAAARQRAGAAAAAAAAVAQSATSGRLQGGSNGVRLDPTLLAGASGVGARASPPWLAAVAASLGVPCARCAVVAAGVGLLKSAKGAGMTAVAVPGRRAGGGSFPGADAVCDGFGPGGGATWRRVRSLIDKRAQAWEEGNG